MASSLVWKMMDIVTWLGRQPGWVWWTFSAIAILVVVACVGFWIFTRSMDKDLDGY